MAHHRDPVGGAIPREARGDMEHDKIICVEACSSEDSQAIRACREPGEVLMCSDVHG